MSVLRKVVASSGGAPSGRPSETVEEAALYPGILEMMTALTYDDGSPREPSVVLLLVEGPMWKACLTDKSNGRNLWRSGATIEHVLSEVEEALQSGQESHWRRSQPKPTKGSKKG